MLTAARLETLADQTDPDRIIDALTRSGLPLSLGLRVRLASSETACHALMLRRLTEVTFGPTRLSRRLTATLLGSQRDDGSWDGDPLTTGCAIAALQRVSAEHRADEAPIRAIHRGQWALATMQRVDGLLIGGGVTDAATARSAGVLILYLLDRVASTWEAVRRTDLTRQIAAEIDRLPAAERLLLEMATTCEGERGSTGTTPAIVRVAAAA